MSSSSLSKRRFWTANFAIACFFVIIIYQLFQLMVIRQPALQDLANKQHDLRIQIPPMRGQILDRKGNELAANLRIPSIYAVPKIIPKNEKAALAKKVADILRIDRAFVLKRLEKDKSFVWIKRKVSEEQAQLLNDLNHPGIGILKEYRRFYPQGDLLSHILGFTNVDNEGLEGIELNYNKELKGSAGKRLTKRDALGREIKALETKQTPAIHGHKITLTIDQYMQYLTERALDRAYKQWKAKGAFAVVMDVKTGEILAMANRPNYDPNQHEKVNPEAKRNRAITDMYEPGSVFKIVAASAALNEGKVTPETMFNCENGNYRYGSKVLHDVHPYGMLSMEDVIVKSSNIGTVKIAAKLDKEVFQSYIDKFGFGRSTGIDLPGEAPGFTRRPKDWSATSAYNIPIGQEVMVTALQMTTALAVIANGGNLVRPYVIAKVEDQAGVVLREKKPLIKPGVIRPEVAEEMRHILTRVVEEGTGQKAKINGIPVGGKTGTAQKVLPNGRGYSHSNFMSSFVGLAPSDKPQYVMTVVLDDPRGMYYGGVVAAPVFKEVMEAALLGSGYVPANATRLESMVNRVPAIPKSQQLSPRSEVPGTKASIRTALPATSH